MNTTNNDIKALTALLIVAVIAFLVGISANTCTLHQTDPVEIIKTEYKTDTVWQDVEVHDTLPQLEYRYITRTDTVYTKDGQEIALNWENTAWSDTLSSGGDTISYMAYVSGIQPRLDSIDIRANRREIHTTETVYIREKQKKNPFFYGLGVFAGYDPFINKPVMGIGATAGIRL